MDSAGRINVLYVMMQMEMGGSERLVHMLAGGLDRGRFNPSIAWFHGERILPEFRDLGVPLFHVPKMQRVDAGAMSAIASIIRDQKIDVVNAHHFMPMVYSFYGSRIRNRVQLVYTEHSEWELEQLPPRWRVMGGLLLRRGNCTSVGVTEAVAQRLHRIFRTGPDRTIAITNGVRTSPAAEGSARDAVKRELGIAAGDRVVGMVANLKNVKNHLLLLRAFLGLAREKDRVKLLLVGQSFAQDPDNAEPRIRAFIEAAKLEKNVILAGYRSDVPALLSLMDVFCLTSFQEGLPLSLIEAMAAGIPVVGTDIDGIRGVVRPGENGFLVGTEDVAGLQKVLAALLADASLRQRLGSAGQRLAKERYSLQHCVEGYQNVYRRVMQQCDTNHRFAL